MEIEEWIYCCMALFIVCIVLQFKICYSLYFKYNKESCKFRLLVSLLCLAVLFRKKKAYRMTNCVTFARAVGVSASN